MARFHRDDILFVAVSAAIFLGICMLTFLGMMRVIYWSIDNCGDAAGCGAAGNLISYWWALFVPVLMFAAYFVNRVYQTRLVKRKTIQG